MNIAKRSMALLLALVLMVGAIPTVFAADSGAFITVPESAWPGANIVAKVDTSKVDTLAGVEWTHDPSLKTNSIQYRVPDDASGSITVSAKVTYGPPGVQKTDIVVSDPVSIKAPATSVTVSGPGSAKVGETVTFDCAGDLGDSEVTWSVSGGASISQKGKFSANTAGTYTVTATAKNGGSVEPVSGSAEITVADAPYKVVMANKVVTLNTKNASMVISVSATDGSQVPDYTTAFSVEDASVATVDNDGVITPVSSGETGVTVSVTIAGEVYSAEAALKVTDQGVITCDQDGREISSDSTTLRFSLEGDERQNVSWNVAATGTNRFSVSDLKESDTGATCTLTAEDGNGAASIDVTATWTGGKASATFYLSFYDTQSYTAVLKDGVDKFTFDKTGVFSKVNGTSSKADKYSMVSFLTDGVGEGVVLSETSKGNSRVGKITVKTNSSLNQYSPSKINDYATERLGDFTFTVLAEGSYKLDYAVYERAGGAGYTTTKGTVTLQTGEASSDIEYDVISGGDVQLSAEDFEKFWDDADAGKSKETLSYVTFEVATATANTGRLRYDDENIKASWRFFADPNSKKDYVIDELSYRAASTKDGYVEYITFLCTGTQGTQVSGVVGFNVISNTMSFSDVKSTDWFYNNVLYVTTRGIMNGVSSTTFDPNGTLTRGMVVTMLYRLEGEPSAAGELFSDLKQDWYRSAVIWAAQNGIVNGVGGDKFAPDSPITREQLAAILYRYTAEYQKKAADISGNLDAYSDADKVSQYALDALKWATYAGIINGDAGKLNPQGQATRAQAAAMFSRLLDK